MVVKQPALAAGYEARIGHNFVVMEQQQAFCINGASFGITLQLWRSKHGHNYETASIRHDKVVMKWQLLSSFGAHIGLTKWLWNFFFFFFFFFLKGMISSCELFTLLESYV